MNKLLVGILVGLAVIAGILLNLTRVVQGPPKPLGNIAGDVQKVASSTASYFGHTTVDATIIPTATTTLHTSNITEADDFTLGVQVTATTTQSVGIVYIQPQTSFDTSTWYDWSPPITGIDTAVNSISIINASTTFIIWTPAGTAYRTFKLGEITAKFIRFKVWTTGTSTVLLEGFKKLTN